MSDEITHDDFDKLIQFENAKRTVAPQESLVTSEPSSGSAKPADAAAAFTEEDAKFSGAIEEPAAVTVRVPRETFEAALAYIKHCGSNQIMRGEPHPQQFIVDGMQKAWRAAAPIATPASQYADGLERAADVRKK